MDEPHAPPRKRRRIRAWLIAAVILLPVLYVAADGPFRWRIVHRGGFGPWYAKYQLSLLPVYRVREFYPAIRAYNDWWESLPGPRGWQRAKYREEIESRKKMIADLERKEPGIKEKAAQWEAMNKRAYALRATGPIGPGDGEELERIEQWMSVKRNQRPAEQAVQIADSLAKHKARIQALEAKIRQLDAK